jgi:hypothetical protein
MALCRLRVAKRAALLASTALIALLTACQTTTGNGSGSSTSNIGPQNAGWVGW